MSAGMTARSFPVVNSLKIIIGSRQSYSSSRVLSPSIGPFNHTRSAGLCRRMIDRGTARPAAHQATGNASQVSRVNRLRARLDEKSCRNMITCPEGRGPLDASIVTLPAHQPEIDCLGVIAG